MGPGFLDFLYHEWVIFGAIERVSTVTTRTYRGEYGRNQKLTVRTPPNNENNFKKFYRSFETVKSMNFMHCSACTHRFSSLNIDLTVELHRHQR